MPTATQCQRPARPDVATASVTGLTDSSGTLTGTTSYDAFGAVRSQTGASLSLGYTGELTDPSTGFVDLRARELDPTLGRFLSADTVQPNAPGSQGYNLYAYVANNPTTWTDPSGYSTNGDAAGAAGTAAAVSVFSLLLFTSLAAACFAFIGCGPFLVAGALFSSTGGLLAVTGLLIAVFAEVACSLNAACYAATQQIGQTIKAYGSAAAAGAWSGGPGDARNAIGALPVIPVVQSVINEYRYFTQRSKQGAQSQEAGATDQGAAGSAVSLYQVPWPANLPKGGEFPYVPPKGYPPGMVEKNRQGNYEDRKGNEWVWDPVKEEWDVQLKGRGHRVKDYRNVAPDGYITHPKQKTPTP